MSTLNNRARSNGRELKQIIIYFYLLMSKYVITLNNRARSNRRDEDEKKNIFVNVIN